MGEEQKFKRFYSDSSEGNAMQRYAFDLQTQYGGKLQKKMNEKPIEVQEMMLNSFNTAILVLAQLYDVPAHEQIMSVFVYCRNEPFRAISKEFEAQIELASIAPEKFIFQLHAFYNKIAAKLREPHMFSLFVQFSGLFSRLMFTKSSQVGMNLDIALAFTHLVLQTYDYLRPKKLDMTQTVVGCTTDGSPMTVKDPYQYWDLAQWYVLQATHIALKNGASAPSHFNYLFAKFGYPQIDTMEEGIQLGREQRLFGVTRAAMAPFINEYTFDIFPQQIHNCHFEMLYLFKIHDIDIAALKGKLCARRHTLPANGIRVTFKDPTECLKSLLMKEIVYNDSVVLLYKLTLDGGELSGYYDNGSQFFYTPILDAVNDKWPTIIGNIVLYCYASAVLDDDTFSDTNFPSHFANFIYTVEAESFGMGGKLKNTYQPTSPSTGSRTDSTRYEAKERAINGFIRKLPAGQEASQEAVERAKKMGYSLAADETYVSPFMRTEFYLKKKDDPTPDDGPDKKSDAE